MTTPEDGRASPRHEASDKYWKAREWRRVNGKDVYCLWCAKEIGDWINCECHVSKWRAVLMTAADLGLSDNRGEANT